MKQSLYKPLLLFSSLLICSLLAACGAPQGGTGASIQPTAHTNPQPTTTSGPASAVVGLGKDYAFVRDNQVWVALNGAAPVQATHFTQIESTNVWWSQPLWFDNDHFLTFTLKVINGGIGGAGCGLDVSYSRGDELFVLNTSTLQLTAPTVPGDKPATLNSGTPYIGHWDALFQEDDTHLLAWYGAVNVADPSSMAGLYRYDFTKSAFTLIIPAASVPGADNNQAMRPMRYSHGQLFYEAMAPVDDKRGFDYAIYSHSLSNPAQPSVEILDVGRETYCTMGDGPQGPFTEPGWDVSPDGTHLVAQVLIGSDLVHVSSQIRLITLQGDADATIFQQVSPQVLNADLALKWGPDGQTIALEAGATSQAVLATTNIANAGTIQSYTTSGVSQYGYYPIIWSADSTAFALLTPGKVDLFTIGQPTSKLLLDNASNFAWGVNQ